MAGAIGVLELNRGGFGEAQAAAIDAAQKSPGAQIALGADGQELLDLGHAVKPWHTRRTSGAFYTMQQRLDVLLEHFAVEGTDGVDGQVNGGRSLLALGD